MAWRKPTSVTLDDEERAMLAELQKLLDKSQSAVIRKLIREAHQELSRQPLSAA